MTCFFIKQRNMLVMMQKMILMRFLQLQIIASTLTYGTFVSDSNNEIIDYSESPMKPLETDQPWEFNMTLMANQSVGFNVTLQNDAYFATIQVHSYVNKITLQDNTGKLQTGTNLGFVNVVTSKNSVNFIVYNINTSPIKILGFIIPYGLLVPIPGACLPSNETIESTLQLQISDHLINLTAHKALLVNLDSQTCSADDVVYKLDYMYTPEKDLSEATYFQGIRTMVIPELRKKDASQYYLGMLNLNKSGTFRLLLAKYPGTGLLLNLIAESDNFTSSYVVAHTFGCNHTTNRPSCFYLVETAHRVELIVLCVTGLILCFCGYEWKSFELAVMSFLLVGLIVYTSLYNVLAVDAKVSASIITGILIGFFLALSLLFTKLSHIRHIVTFLVFGLLTASSIMYYSGLGNIAVFKLKEVYWPTFIVIVISSILTLYLNPASAHYITSSAIGSFLAVVTLDYFAGSSLKFLYLDNIRRAAVENFIEAYISPPFQAPDGVIFALWLAVGISSFAYQYLQQSLCCQTNPEDFHEIPHSFIDSTSNPSDPIDFDTDVRYFTFDDIVPLIDSDSE